MGFDIIEINLVLVFINLLLSTYLCHSLPKQPAVENQRKLFVRWVWFSLFREWQSVNYGQSVKTYNLVKIILFTPTISQHGQYAVISFCLGLPSINTVVTFLIKIT